MEASRVTARLDAVIEYTQISVAVLLALLLVGGVVNLALLLGRSVIAQDILLLEDTFTLIADAIDLVLYLFIVVELYRTVVAYVEARSVVRAVVHAGIIGVTRQIITFKPGDYADAGATLMAGATYTLLLLALFVGFYVVHQEPDDELRE
jgi:uncharacterized membrane protein (DUF373 family)